MQVHVTTITPRRLLMAASVIAAMSALAGCDKRAATPPTPVADTAPAAPMAPASAASK